VRIAVKPVRSRVRDKNNQRAVKGSDRRRLLMQSKLHRKAGCRLAYVLMNPVWFQ
jgi:hypothetical protein